ncbi:hypothetical protein [Sphingobacterium paucimobilis]|uniref:DUF4890 domain-containing protein n=1 Tax=Sphingobacterium paucimobilis HER1398 TaxID=1346330 RepID=U2HUI8_9SPHI|nr:hypothetical protein [Sphingobacterium paucimobilis]ERJ58945.1 hypothetical protein M472_09190 [Sphingobacterium paucimobilis HER1398]
MKKALITTAFTLLLSLSLFAQTKPKGIFLHHTKVMDALNMTPEQRTKIIEIRKATDVKVITEDASLSEAEKKKAMTAMYRKRTKEQHEVLTEEQLKKLKQMQADAKKEN